MLMDGLVSEAVEVARRKGIPIEGNPIEKVKAVAEATKANRCSMGQDLDNKRRTEIDVINGAVVREAERLGVAVPYNRMITNLIKVIEKTYQFKDKSKIPVSTASCKKKMTETESPFSKGSDG